MALNEKGGIGRNYGSTDPMQALSPYRRQLHGSYSARPWLVRTSLPR
jgi:hypothetical protein